MTSIALAQASEWDRIINEDAPDSLLEGADQLSGVMRLRRLAQIALASNDRERVVELLGLLETEFPEASQGVRLLLLVHLGHYDSVVSAPRPALRSLDPEAIEDACDAAFARAMALVQRHQFEGAAAQLLLARELAGALGMEYRVQLISLEHARLMTNMGQPEPEKFREAMGQKPMSQRRHAWATASLAEAFIALGDYQGADTLLQAQRGDLKAFTAALLGQEVTSHTDGPYAQLGRAVQMLRTSDGFHVPGITDNSPQAEYAAIFRAWAMLRTRSMASQAYNLLLGLRVYTADQRAHRAAALIYAAALQSGGDEIEALVAEFNDALRAMRVRAPFLELLRSLSPDAYALLGFLPKIHTDLSESLPDIPLLVGTSIAYQYRHIKLPGRASGSLVWVSSAAQGLTGREARPHPQALQRLREALQRLEATQFVNLGSLIRALIHFRDAARLARRPTWNAAIDRALGWLDSEALRQDLHKFAYP